MVYNFIFTTVKTPPSIHLIANIFWNDDTLAKNSEAFEAYTLVNFNPFSL
jgi:hypothetical protein